MRKKAYANSVLSKIKTYVRELTIITIGVLIALFVSNFKESNQAGKYYRASTKTVKNEILSNYSNLRDVIEKQVNLRDTIEKYCKSEEVISELILEKGGGLQIATLNNSGLDFYKKNKIELINFDMMTRLLSMESTSSLINKKTDKLMDYIYPNLFSDAEKSKRLTITYMNNLLESELTLIQSYKEFIEEYIDKESELK